MSSSPPDATAVLDRNSDAPLWMQFRDALRSQILKGELNVGAKLPTEAELGEQYGISRIVVREALADLVRNGLIYKIRGQGAFVSTRERDEDFVSTVLGFSDEMERTLTELGAAGLLHDVGKARIPEEILFKPAPLDDEERQIMKRHPQIGAELLLDSASAGQMAIGAAWGHYLRHDGGGYPAHRPWAVRSQLTALIQVCDIFEALTAARPYKRALSPQRAYEIAGVTPRDLDVLDVHDASAPAEIMIYEEIGLCPEGEGGRLIDEGVTQLGGKQPVNTSGGLLAKGHPVGATGVAQIAEVYWQLKGEAGGRQVEGAKLGLTENGGGAVRGEPAAMSVHILST